MKTNISDAQLLHFNSLGLIPGPDETEESFLARVEYCLHLADHLPAELPFEKDILPSQSLLETPLAKSKRLYGIQPRWILIFFNNYQLSPWHGGCAWIFQQDDAAPTSSFLQLRKAFLYSSTYLGIYQRDELIVHELAHVGRMVFEEPQFEELLAYRSSQNRWRKHFGPIVRSARESALFVLTLLIVLIADFFSAFNSQPALNAIVFWIKFIPIAMIAFALIRLWRLHSLFDQCFAHLRHILGDEEKANAVVYRLKDSEINYFAKTTPEEIKLYVSQSKDSSLRWRLIYLAYFII